jgi:hypothetical protein
MRRLAPFDTLLFLAAVVAAIVAIELAAPVMLSSTASEGAPLPTSGLVCFEPVVDMARVDGSKPIEHTFMLTNVSEVPVRILETKTTCGCTSLDFTKNPVQPGGTIPVTVTIDWNGRAGGQQAAIFVRNDAPGSVPQRLEVRGSVIYHAAIVPASIELAPGVGRNSSRHFFVIGSEILELRVARVENVPDGWRVFRVEDSGELSDVLSGPPGRFILFRESSHSPERALLRFIMEGDAAQELLLPVVVRD